MVSCIDIHIYQHIYSKRGRACTRRTDNYICPRLAVYLRRHCFATRQVPSANIAGTLKSLYNLDGSVILDAANTESIIHRSISAFLSSGIGAEIIPLSCNNGSLLRDPSRINLRAMKRQICRMLRNEFVCYYNLCLIGDILFDCDYYNNL